jgi:hypothetical protein
MLPDRTLLACTGRADEMCVDSWRPAHQRAKQERTGKAICAGCPTLDRCRTWVLNKPDDPSPVMVVGGMTPGERRRARPPAQPPPERQQLAPCGTNSAYQRHRRRGEHCPTCAAAWSAYSQTYHQLRKQGKGAA